MKASSSLTSLRQVGVAAGLSLAVAALGSFIWSALLVGNARTTPAVPWSVPAMALVLVGYWWYLSGHGWPSRTGPARAALLRARRVPLQVFGWSLLAGGLSLVTLVGLWIVLVELTGNGGNPTISGLAGYPAIFVALAIAMGSLVSPLTEEAAFRGYAQVLLERRFSAVVAVVISSLFFAAWHGPTQGFFWSKLLFFFAVGLVFGSIAYLTNSTLPALPVHVVGDVLFFTLIWPHDAGRPLVWTHGADATFWLEAAQTVVFAVLAVIALRQLRNISRHALRPIVQPSTSTSWPPAPPG